MEALHDSHRIQAVSAHVHLLQRRDGDPMRVRIEPRPGAHAEAAVTVDEQQHHGASVQARVMSGPKGSATDAGYDAPSGMHSRNRPILENMEIKNISAASPFDPTRYVAEEFLEGHQSNVRIIKLSPGTVLPPHKHGESDLMLYVVEGVATLQAVTGAIPFSAGDLAFIAHDEELRVWNDGDSNVTLLAFLTPKFPPRAS